MKAKAVKDEVLDFHSLTRIRGLEWLELRKKCRDLKLEGIVDRHRVRSAVFNFTRFIIFMEMMLASHIIMAVVMIKDLELITLLPELILMFIMPLFLMLSLRDSETYYIIHLVCSWVTGLLLSLMDIIVVICQKPRFPVVPCYDHLVLLSVYTMLPIAYQGYNSVYLGAAVSMIYIAYVAWTVDTRESSVAALVAYASYLFFINLVLVFFVCAREYRFLRVILTRYQMVFQNLALKAVMKKEKDLLESILPRTMVRTLQEDVKSRLQDNDDFPRRSSFTRKLFIEPFPEVSILVADMVNYTYLTTTLEVSDLVEILHELFVNFDLAAKKNRSLRIKFLGDAYNCVAGIPVFFPNHANSCVDQALEMISITKDLSHRRHLSINLRIGVHSGELLAGIIGRIRWQFDIWSKDVDITNRLEGSGRPGMVHVSARTLRLLDDQYLFEEGTEQAKQDPILKKAQIHTYLISGRVSDHNFEFSEPEEEVVSSSSVTSYRFSLGDIYDDIETKTMREMVHEVEKLPVGRDDLCNCTDRSDAIEKLTERFMFNGQVHFLIPVFRSWKREKRFHNQPDYLITYSMTLMFVGGLVIFLMGIVDGTSTGHLPVYLGLLVALFLLCLVAVYKKMWLQTQRNPASEYPSAFFSLCLFKLSQLAELAWYFRSALVIQGVILLYFLATLRVYSCDIAQLEVDIILTNLVNENPLSTCFMPWSVTYGVMVVLFLLLIIDGFPFFLTLIVSAILVASHFCTIHAFYGLAFERSESTVEGLRSDYAHTWYLLSFFIVYALLGRHMAYIKKSCFFMRLRYEEKMKETAYRTNSIKIIMANMLPSHVAEVFKERQRHDELYYENFDKVAVMFATIEPGVEDVMGLRALHEFICFFDDLLATYQNKYKIEKIKVMGWTYMVACGLEVDHSADAALHIPELSELSSESRRRSTVSFRLGSIQSGDATSGHTQTKWDHDEDDIAVVVMADFALGLLRVMRKIEDALKGNLKIGISHGSVMAGVVGLSKPYYDIWGHTVNMASRMTSTGVLNEIHVTLNTAFVLRRFNIRCNYRGMTFVKGLGEVPTFLVGLNEDLEFQPNHTSDPNHSEDMLFEKLSLRFAPSFVGTYSPSSGVGLDEGDEEFDEELGEELEGVESKETERLTGGSISCEGEY